MGLLRGCLCALLLIAPVLTVGACSGDDDGSSSGAACHCEWGDTCDEMSADCATTTCESDGANAKGQGACSQMDVVGSCSCASEGRVTYYRSSFTGNPPSECEFWCDDGVYQPL